MGRSLVGCSPWGRKKSDTTERLHFHFYFSLSCIGEGNGNPLQCSCLENPRDGEAWWAAVYGVAQSRTQLPWLSSSSGVKEGFFFFFYFHSFSLSSFLLLEIIKHVYWLIPSFGSHWSALCHMAMLSFKGGWKSTGRVAEVIKGKRKWEPLVSCQNARICSKYFFWSLFLPSFQDFECVPFLSTKIEKWMKWEQYTLQGLLCWDRGLVFLVGPPTNMKWMAPWEG